MRTMPASELVFDPTVYPRHEVDGDHVFNMVEAIRANVKFPPIVICRKSKRIVDGVHRHRANTRLCGADCAVPVVEKDYANDKDLFLDAVRYNALHGKNLARDDRVKIAEIGDRLKIDKSKLGDALKISQSVLGGLASANSDYTDGLKPTGNVGTGKRMKQELKGLASGKRPTHLKEGNLRNYAKQIPAAELIPNNMLGPIIRLIMWLEDDACEAVLRGDAILQKRLRDLTINIERRLDEFESA